jgi:hypothetical protein
MKKRILSAIIITSIFGLAHLAASAIDIPNNTGLPGQGRDIKAVLTALLNWLLSIIGVVAVISFAVSGIQYFLAAGDDTSMETAKRNMLYSIIGVVVALSGFVIVKAVDSALKGNGNF